MKSAKKVKPKSSKKAPAAKKKGQVFTAEEKAAMRDYIREQKAAAKGALSRAEGEREVLAKIAKLPQPDRALAQRVHEIITAAVPELSPKTWYGMPAYTQDDKVVCYFQDAHKFKARYATLGFSDKAKLDEGLMWPIAYALKELTRAEEARIVALVKAAVGQG